VQHSEGINKYTSYRVDVRPLATIPDHQDIMMGHTAYSAVLRRYSDFFWLYERLHVERAGAVVPPIPEKTAVGRFSPQFIVGFSLWSRGFSNRVAGL
jgi:sorting nexin-1/2